MSALDQLAARARTLGQRIVLPEAADPRVAAAARRAADEGLAQITLLDQPRRDPDFDRFVAALVALRAHKGLTEAAAAEALADPLLYAMMMVREGRADGAVAGAATATALVLRAALQTVGPRQPGGLVSSFFLMVFPDDHPALPGPVLFSDCGLVIDPDAGQLAAIALASCDSLTALTGAEPAVAMLSFSTAGSVQHPAAAKVAEATARVRAARPGLNLGGELQFDAALLPEIRAQKVRASDGPGLVGRPNLFVFPNLDAGNIGYKLAQRLGGAVAIGPITQGLAKPVNDLSRGCTAEDIYHLIAVTAVQAAASPAA